MSANQNLANLSNSKWPMEQSVVLYVLQDRREFLSVHRRQFQLHYVDVLSSIAKARVVATKKK